MSIVDIIVVRGAGDKQGTDIEDRLICTVEVALARGRNEFDENSGLQSIAITSVLRPLLRPGHLIEVQDALNGVTWRGKLTSIRHTVSLAGAYSDMQVQRPL